MSCDPYSLPPLDAEWLNSPQARSVEFVPTREDLIAPFRFLFGPQPSDRETRRAFLVLSATIVLALMWLLLQRIMADRAARGLQTPSSHPLMNTIAITVLITIAVGVTILYYVSRQTIEKQIDRRFANPQTRRELLAPRRVTIAPQGCLIQIGAVSQTYTWDSIEVKGAADYCFLMLAPNIILAPLCARVFPEGQDFFDFYESCRKFKEATSQPSS